MRNKKTWERGNVGTWERENAGTGKQGNATGGATRGPLNGSLAGHSHVPTFPRSPTRRRAAAAVEMAVVMPLLLTILFGIIEYGWVFTIKQGLTNAAREGARTAVLQGASDSEINQRINAYLAPLGITTHHVTITHATDANPTETIHVTVPYSDVTLIGSYFGSTNYNLGATCSMRKEGTD